MTYDEAYDYFKRAYKHESKVDETDFFTDDKIVIALVHKKISRIDIFSYETNNSVKIVLDEYLDHMQMLQYIHAARSIVL